ncbi:hypothetical protein B1B05_04360 [Domibacillus enclensis]|uniref:Uncharacterized protein n=1 Tax=Domibacillus enclensis TaxID=1017273 RepID=A0ABX4EB65_9BACI|nr:hypothetical protein B1B05_04360 [Domibacillus enclensis]
MRSGFGAPATKTSSPLASQKSGAGSPEPLNVLFQEKEESRLSDIQLLGYNGCPHCSTLISFNK